VCSRDRGAEFVSLTDDNHSQNDWLRGPCRYGIMPCNGMLYVPPHQCFCYSGAMMTGLNAFTTAPDDELRAIGAGPAGERLQRGPAYDEIRTEEPAIQDDDWHMYRHDPRRTGATASEVPAELRERWRVELGGRLTPPVAANGRVYVAAKDGHTVHALAADGGREFWQFTAAGGLGLVAVGCCPHAQRCGRCGSGNGAAWIMYHKARNVQWTYEHTSVLVARLLANMGVGPSTPLVGRFQSPAR
jgi:hypothetical protein